VKPDEAAYLQRRAETATHLATRAAHPGAVRAHYAMAQAYLDRLHPAPEKAADRRSA